MDTKQLQIKTVTPISVSSGDIFSPVSDFFIWDKKVCFIAQQKLEEELLEKDLMGRYVKNIQHKTSDPQKSNFDLFSFIENELGEDPWEYVKYSIPYPNHSKGKLGELYRHIKSNEQPFIPGSSLKGAVKTALFYNWLKKTEEGKKELENLVQKINGLRDEIELFYNKKYLNKKKKKKLNESFESTWKPLVKKYIDKTDKNGKHFFSGLSISDTNLFDKDSIEVFSTQRLHLKKEQSIPQIKECIKKNQESNFDIKADIGIESSAFVQIINQFAYKAILTEQEIFENLPELANSNALKNLDTFHNQLTDDMDEIERNKTSDFYLRIGSGKSYYDNTIGMAIFEQDENAFNLLRKLYQLGKAPGRHYKLIEPFPITRTVIDKTFEPMGWVKIRIKNNQNENTFNQPGQ